jgi:hypothetical protein
MEENVDTGVVAGAGVVAHRLAVVDGVGREAGAGACVKVGLADNPIDAKMSSSVLGAGAFLTGATAGFFVPRLVICNGAPPTDVAVGWNGVLP